MSYEEIDLLGQLTETLEGPINDNDLIELLSAALELTEGDHYEAIAFLTQNSHLSHQRLYRLYKGFLKSA